MAYKAKIGKIWSKVIETCDHPRDSIEVGLPGNGEAIVGLETQV